ncbi:hypothetical protein BDP27DRAFT_1262445 [Rhodocollybia butyracea]|uniref:Uncharacterized protein n=1 Tax=Rhodocollybia butyracea TaxID=206335 RepID=A0A9P5PSZ3_9AGAR|nr:hypothetical protein BDP27DRAFT_1262445 [Rhodocollybia butyracea]
MLSDNRDSYHFASITALCPSGAILHSINNALCITLHLAILAFSHICIFFTSYSYIPFYSPYYLQTHLIESHVCPIY